MFSTNIYSLWKYQNRKNPVVHIGTLSFSEPVGFLFFFKSTVATCTNYGPIPIVTWFLSSWFQGIIHHWDFCPWQASIQFIVSILFLVCQDRISFFSFLPFLWYKNISFWPFIFNLRLWISFVNLWNYSSFVFVLLQWICLVIFGLAIIL